MSEQLAPQAAPQSSQDTIMLFEALIGITRKYDLLFAYLMERSGVSMADFNAWVKERDKQ